mmetsp:Transcript_8530/g.26651  ORF Transcript_8530/g.26651 Transcript_8530/m.26651 type:complete len:297 (+) Transcript_8530:593-1483(+)
MPQAIDYTAALPVELLDIVLHACGFVDARACLSVDKRWRERALRDDVWNRLAVDRWGSSPDVRRGGATLSGFAARYEDEGDATVFFSVVQRYAARADGGIDVDVVAECALAPGDYPAWWRKVAKATALRALRAPPGTTVTIEVGDIPDAHRRARRRRHGTAHVRTVLVTTSLDVRGAATGTFCACLAVFPLQEPGADHAAALVRKRGVSSFLRRLRDWLGVEAFFARPPDARAAPRPPAVSLDANDPVDKAFLEMRAPEPRAYDVDPAHVLERFMVAANAAMARLGFEERMATRDD